MHSTKPSKSPSPPAHSGRSVYKREQWIESFEGQLAILRPHLAERVLATMANTAWHKHGRNDEDPISAAKAWSETLTQRSPQAGPTAGKKQA